jgi:hypothetical protein
MSNWGKNKVTCEVCNVEVAFKGMKNHVASAMHQRAIGALPPKPEPPPKRPRGRPKKEGPLFHERNPKYYTTTTKWCDLCEKDIIRGSMNSHRGTLEHLRLYREKVLAEAMCVPCASTSSTEVIDC